MICLWHLLCQHSEPTCANLQGTAQPQQWGLRNISGTCYYTEAGDFTVLSAELDRHNCNLEEGFRGPTGQAYDMATDAFFSTIFSTLAFHSNLLIGSRVVNAASDKSLGCPSSVPTSNDSQFGRVALFLPCQSANPSIHLQLQLPTLSCGRECTAERCR